MSNILENKTIIVRILVVKICPGFDFQLDFFKVMLFIARKLNHNEYNRMALNLRCTPLFISWPSDYKTIIPRARVGYEVIK